MHLSSWSVFVNFSSTGRVPNSRNKEQQLFFYYQYLGMFTCYLIQTGGPVTRPEPRCFASSLLPQHFLPPCKNWKRRNHNSEWKQERQVGTLLFLELLGDSKSKKLAVKSLYRLVHSLARHLIPPLLWNIFPNIKCKKR